MQTVTMQRDQAQFTAAAGRYRTELLVHCYRMLGSVHEAEDLVQETYLRAWRSYRSFEGRSSLRTYLYRIATNACLTALRRPSRRILPADAALGAGEPRWLEPIPDALLTADADPATVVDARAGVRLAFIAALQHLSPIRRAVLVLRDVVGLPAAKVAQMLGITTAAVNSALPRARAQIAQSRLVIDEVAEPPEPRRRALLDRYVAAFHNADVTALGRLLRDDIALEMPPRTEWFHGRAPVVEFFATRVLRAPEQFQMVATAANGQPAFVAYQRTNSGSLRPHAVHVLTIEATGISHITVFLEPAVCAQFNQLALGHEYQDQTGAARQVRPETEPDQV